MHVPRTSVACRLISSIRKYYTNAAVEIAHSRKSEFRHDVNDSIQFSCLPTSSGYNLLNDKSNCKTFPTSSSLKFAESADHNRKMLTSLSLSPVFDWLNSGPVHFDGKNTGPLRLPPALIDYLDFPSWPTELIPKLSPSIESQEKLDPPLAYGVVVEIECPSPMASGHEIVYECTRMVKIHMHRMKKKKRNRRYRKQKFQYAKKHREKKRRAEVAFVKRCNTLIMEAVNFDPVAYMENLIEKSEWRPPEKYTATGKRIHPHWMDTIGLEQLYQLRESDFIDKRACLADEEEWPKIQQLRRQYYERLESLKSKKSGQEEQ